jgi:hypothetical protein
LNSGKTAGLLYSFCTKGLLGSTYGGREELFGVVGVEYRRLCAILQERFVAGDGDFSRHFEIKVRRKMFALAKNMVLCVRCSPQKSDFKDSTKLLMDVIVMLLVRDCDCDAKSHTFT